MDISIILAIIGITATIIFGVWAVLMTLRYKYPGEITYLNEQKIALFDSIVKNLPELSITYHNSPVTPNLVLIKGTFFNSGRKDITPTMVDKPISLELPQNYKWLTAKVISSSKNVKSEIKFIDERTLNIETNLFRCKEFIRFQALLEIPTDKQGEKDNDSLETQIRKALEFSHRISDTRKIKEKKLASDEKQGKYYLKRRIYLVSGPIIVAIVVIVFFIFFIKWPQTFAYNYKLNDSDSILVKIEPLINNEIKINGIRTSYKDTLDIKEFFINTKNIPSIVDDKKATESITAVIILLIIYVMAPIFYVLGLSIQIRKNRKLRELLKMDEN